MNDQEAKEFLNDIIAINFPSIMNWIEKNSQDPRKTRENWRKLLQDVEVDEALWFASQMLNGEVKFAAYEYDQFPVRLRLTCIERRAKIREDQRRDSFLKELQSAKHGKKSIIQELGLLHYVTALVEMKSRIAKSQISDSEKIQRTLDAEREVLLCHTERRRVPQELIERF